MGHRPDSHSLQRRLRLLIFVISTSALLAFMLVLLALQYMNERRQVITSHQALASVIANSSAAALTFEDRNVALETLSRLATVPSVDFAAVFRDGGSQFVKYVRSGDPAINVPETASREYAKAPFFSEGRLFVAAPISADSRPIGLLVLAINLDEEWVRAYQTIALALLLTLLLSFAAYSSSRIAVSKVTKPVENLSDVVRLVSQKQDYSERAEIFHDDEIGTLARGFNAMLKKIQERDAELSEHRATLEHIVEERTQQLHERNENLSREIAERTKVQADLVQAKELAEQASQAKSEFLANISHEIRTPLNAVIGLSDLLVRTELTGRQRRFVDAVSNAGRSLLALINDVLDFSKCEAGAVSIHEEDLDLRTLAAEAGSFLNGLAQQKGLELSLQVSGEVPERVRADGLRIRQILVNLVNNAIKFTEKGQVNVRLSFEPGSEGSGVARLVVSDTGIGIAAKDLDRIFNAFEQVDASATRNFGGSGLGLAITRKLVEALNGSIAVESGAGVGSTFSVAIPMTVSRSDVAGPEKARDALGSVPVLIVAADGNDSAILEAFLSGWDMRPTVTSATAAIATLGRAAQEGEAFGLLICDLGPPDQGSLELIRCIRADPVLASTPAILILPSRRDDAPALQLADARVASLAKPLTQSGLQNQIRELLEEDAAAFAASDAQLPAYALQILLTEDNATNRVVALENLSSLGCTADVAVDGLEAVEAFQQKKYDLIFMDCQMPKLDGFGATQRIRELEKGGDERTHTPIVALTAHAMVGDREKCLANGMDDYLVKPFTLEDMIACLERWCAHARQARSSTARPAASVSVNGFEDRDPAGEPDRSRYASVFDEAHVGNLRRTKPGLWSALRVAFLAEAGAARDVLALALESGDWANVRLVAHTMKSAAANVGATGLAEASKSLEKAAKAKDMDACSRHAAEFETLIIGVCAAMESEASSGALRATR